MLKQVMAVTPRGCAQIEVDAQWVCAHARTGQVATFAQQCDPVRGTLRLSGAVALRPVTIELRSASKASRPRALKMAPPLWFAVTVYFGGGAAIVMRSQSVRLRALGMALLL